MFLKVAVICGLTTLVGAVTTDSCRQCASSVPKPRSSRLAALPSSNVQEISDSGLSFLLHYQKADGSWQEQGQDTRRVTALVLTALASCVNHGRVSADPHQALAVFRLALAENSGIGLPRKLLVEGCDFDQFPNGGVNVDALAGIVDRLRTGQCSDGGWTSGESRGATSSVIATAEAVLVLRVVCWDLENVALRRQPASNQEKGSTVAENEAIFSRSAATFLDS